MDPDPKKQNMRFKLMRAFSLTAGLLASGMAGQVRAEQNPIPADVDPSATVGTAFDEIIVTARRREERVQTVPIAVTAFTQANLDQRHIEQIRDLVRAVPSLSFSANASDVNSLYSGQVRIRGLPGSEVYFADVPLGNTDHRNTTGTSHGLSPGYYFDLESIEVYKGAQGTLFGRPSIGGLFSIEPRRPTDRFEGFVQTQFGSYSDNKNDFALNLPVVDGKLLVRVNGEMQQRDGYTRDLRDGVYLDNQNYYSWRIGITLKPSDSFENYFLYDGYWQDSNGSSAILRAANPNIVLGRFDAKGNALAPGTTAGCFITATLGGPAFAPLSNLPGGCGQFRAAIEPGIGAALTRQQQLGPRTVAGRFTSGIGKDYFYGFTDIARWDVTDTLTVKNIAAARIIKQLGPFDFTDTGLGVLTYGYPGNNRGWNDNAAQYSEELHLEGRSPDDRLHWVAGGFLLFDHPLGYNTELYDALGVVTFNHFHESDRSQAVFVHGIYDLSDFVSNLRFTAGYRYSWDYDSLNETATKPIDIVLRNAGGLPTNCFLALSDRNCARSIESHFSAPSWNLGLDEQLTPDTLIYVRAGNTYRPGGTNPPLQPPDDRFGPEHVTDVELGIKTDWTLAGIRGRTNADIYHTDYKAVQVSQFRLIPSPNAGRAPSIQPVLANAASAELEGAEIEQTLALPYDVDLSGEGAYFNGHYNDYPMSLGGGGNPGFQYVPRFSFAITALYRLPVDESWGKISAGITWSWSGHLSVSPLANEPINSIPHSQDFDLRADWTDMFGRPLDSAFFMTNATDNLYMTGAIPLITTLGIASSAYNQPRMYGFSLKYRFGPHR
jgi:iron complex outermembrane receptor protein